MSIIRSHTVTLYGGNDRHNLVLRPMCDEDIPLLCDLNSDMEVLRWSDNEATAPYTEETVRKIYGSVSQSAYCFIIELDQTPVGECWLQKMNLKDVLKNYDVHLDVRRIDMSIGKKQYWGRGVGTQCVRMLMDFAFHAERVDVLHCLCDDENVRSNRIWIKHGFTRVEQTVWREEPLLLENHYRLTRRQYQQNRRFRPAEERIFLLPLATLQPSQLYVSEGKLANVAEWFDPHDQSGFDPIPVKEYMGTRLMTDGHTRAVCAHLAGWTDIPVYWDEDDLDMDAYALSLAWCKSEGINDIAALSQRIVSHTKFEHLWRKRCMEKE